MKNPIPIKKETTNATMERMKEYPSACPNCGGSEFVIDEHLTHYATLKAQVLAVDNTESLGIQSIICEGCDKDYDESEFWNLEM